MQKCFSGFPMAFYDNRMVSKAVDLFKKKPSFLTFSQIFVDIHKFEFKMCTIKTEINSKEYSPKML